MAGKHSLTFYLILLHLVIIPLVPAKVYVGPIPVSAQVVLIPLLTLAVIYEYVRNRVEFNTLPIKTFMILFGLFFLVQIISLSQAISIIPAIKEMVRYLSYVFLFFIVTKVKFSKQEYHAFALTFVGTIAAAGLWGVASYAFNLNLNKAGLYALEEAYGRVHATMANPNYWAGFVNFILPMLLLFAVVRFKERKWQLLMFALFSIYVINQIFTYTRSAWVIMALGMILTSLLVPKHFYKKVFKVHMIVAIVLLGLIVYNLPDVQERTRSALYVAQSFLPEGSQQAQEGDGLSEEEKQKRGLSEKAAVSRTTLWKTGWVMYKENPVLGLGIGNYGERYKEYVTKYPELYVGHDEYSVHNSYLKVGAETGTIGLLSFLAIYLYYYFFLGKQFIRNREDLTKKLLLVGLFVGSGTYAGQNLANNLIFIPQLNVLFWLVSGLIFNYVHTVTNKA